jgi:site-specific recombinase XerD
LGHPVVDDYLRLVKARVRPNSLLAVAFDLKVFFEVVGREPVEITTRDVLAFIEAQRQPRRGSNVVRIDDGEQGLSARTVKRRLSSVSGLFAFLVARGDVDSNPVPRGLSTRCHELRHTCLTRLREAGMALEAVQAQAGHRSIESTRIYLHLSNGWLVEEYRRAMDVLHRRHSRRFLAIIAR